MGRAYPVPPLAWEGVLDRLAKPGEIFPQNLVLGYETFLGGEFRRERATFHELAEKGQHPHTLVIGCCDSRVMPEEIFAAAPGEIFDIRNVANLVPSFDDHERHHSVWAAVDYALTRIAGASMPMSKAGRRVSRRRCLPMTRSDTGSA